MTITNRVKITISPLRLHGVSSVRIHTSTHSFRTLLPTVRIIPLNLFSASSVDLHGTSYTNVLRNDLRIRLNHQFYVNILILSKDLVCILAFLSAMPRVATVVNIYVQILLILHL